MLYACLYTLFVRQTCNLPYTVGILMNVIMHAQFDVLRFCCVLELKLEVSVDVFRSSSLGSVWFGGVGLRIPQSYTCLQFWAVASRRLDVHDQEYIRDKSVQPPYPSVVHPFSKVMQ